jgi:hypothetical protein
MAPKNPKSTRIPMAQQLPRTIDCYRGKTTMPNRKRRARLASGHHRQTLPAVLYLSGAVLILNAWLVTQQIFSF